MSVFNFIIDHDVTVFVGINAGFAFFVNIDSVPADVNLVAVLLVDVHAVLE